MPWWFRSAFIQSHFHKVKVTLGGLAVSLQNYDEYRRMKYRRWSGWPAFISPLVISRADANADKTTYLDSSTLDQIQDRAKGEAIPYLVENSPAASGLQPDTLENHLLLNSKFFKISFTSWNPNKKFKEKVSITFKTWNFWMPTPCFKNYFNFQKGWISWNTLLFSKVFYVFLNPSGPPPLPCGFHPILPPFF